MISCVEDRITLESIDAERWKEETIDFAFKNCSLEKNAYNQEGMPAFYNEKNELITLKEDFESTLDSRRILLDTLLTLNLYKASNRITIDEEHNKSGKLNPIIASFKIYPNTGISYSFSIFADHKIEIQEIPNINTEEIKLINYEKCINDLNKGYPLDLVIIKTVISKDVKGKIIYNVEHMAFGFTSH